MPPSRSPSREREPVEEPALGWQLAPEARSSSERDAENEGRGESSEPVRDLEKVATLPDDEHGGSGRPTSSTEKSRQNEGPPPSAGFWHWKMAGVRIHVLKLWLRTNLILGICIFACLCLFWGALFRQTKKVHMLRVWVVDFDGQAPYSNTTPFVGPFVTQTIHKIASGGGIAPGYTFASPSDFGNDPLKVRESVYDFHAWAAVIINPNATALLDAAVRQGNASYDPLGACQIIYNSARDQTTASSYITPAMTALQKQIVSVFGRAWISHLMQNNVSATDMHMDVSPQAISPGIEFTQYDLRPFGPPVATPAVTIGLIYLIVISFFSFTFFLPIHMKYLTPKGHPPLHFSHLIVWRYFATVISYFFLSLIYSLVSLAFLMPMNNPTASPVWPASNPNAYGKGTFVVYWMVNWVGMTAFGLASENVAMVLGNPWTAVWLIFWIITNVSTGFYTIDLAPGFYRWGYAWPLHNIIEVTRSTLFDLHPRVGLNFGVLFAWCAIDTILFPFCCYFMRWKTMRAKKQEAKKQAEWHAKMDKERENPGLLARVTTTRSRKDDGPRRRDVESRAQSVNDRE